MNTVDPYVEEVVRDIEVAFVGGGSVTATLHPGDTLEIDDSEIRVQREDAGLRTEGRLTCDRSKVTYWSVLTRTQRKHNPDYVPKTRSDAPDPTDGTDLASL